MFGPQAVETPRAVKYSHNHLCPLDGSLRPHVGPDQRPSGHLAKLGAPGHSSQLSRWPRGCGELGGLTSRLGPLEVAGETVRKSRAGWRHPWATRWGTGGTGIEGSEAPSARGVALSSWQST